MSLSTNPNPSSIFSISMYNTRASTYDNGAGGWHVALGMDFVAWIQPTPGSTILDLACGTGLVSIPMAKAVGPNGLVIAIDISPGMLNEARRKPIPEDSGKIEWIEHDITAINELSAVNDLVKSRGGFDVISCCSALVLLPYAASVIKHWTALLKPGGKMIIDVPTEDKTVQHLLTVDVREAVGKAMPYDRSWVTDMKSLEKLYMDAGLIIERSFRTRSYMPEKWYKKDEWESALDQQIQTFSSFGGIGNVDEARRVFKELWMMNLRNDGTGELKFWDGHALYVSIGVKPS